MVKILLFFLYVNNGVVLLIMDENNYEENIERKCLCS